MPGPVDIVALRGVAFPSVGDGEEQILDAALAIAVDYGTCAVTITAIADRLDVTSSVIHAYFADRDQVILALLQREARQLADALLDALNSVRGDTLQVAVAAGVQSLLQAVRARPQSWRFVVFSTHEPAFASRFVRERIMIGDLVATLLRPALRAWWPITADADATTDTAADAVLSVLIAHVMSLCEATVCSLLGDASTWTRGGLGDTGRTHGRARPERGFGTLDSNSRQ
jgi:AcrR family transcriptional regulator